MTSTMTSTLNPRAKEFIPSKTDDFVRNQLHHQDHIVQIPKITCYDDLQQVAQIAYTNLTCKPSYFELYWDGKRAILDSPSSSFQFPDMNIRQIVRYYFDETPFEFAQDDVALDQPASNAPAIAINIIPIYHENIWRS